LLTTQIDAEPKFLFIFYFSTFNYFLYLRTQIIALMKKYESWIGIVLIVAGAILLLISYLLHHTTNAVLLTGLLLIIVGVVGYIQGIKRNQGY
jgi:membrane-bound ClpP family serine protease